MAITIVNTWTDTEGDQDSENVVNATPGNWLFAVVVARVVDGSSPTLAVGDVSRCMWQPLADNTKFASSVNQASVSQQLQAEIWACPAIRYDGWPWALVYASAMQITASDVGSLLVGLYEVSGMSGQPTVDAVVLGTAIAATGITLVAPAPAGSANCLMLAGAIADSTTTSSVSGTGWTGLTGTSRSTPTARLVAAWREATTGGSTTLSLTSGVANWAGVLVSLKTAGATLSQPNPAWPPTQLQIGLGYDMATPLSRVRWTDQTPRYRSLSSSRGIQAELGTAQQGQTTLELRNDDGALSPRTVALASSANAAGTTTTIKMPDASALAIHVADFFRLKTSLGALKELNVFQVVSLASAAGTTTVTFKRADGTAGGAQASTASGDIYAGIAIDLYLPWRLLKTVAGTTYCVASGWLRDLPLAFENANRAKVDAVGSDALEALSAIDDPSALRGEIYRRPGLYAYWPLDDPSGSAYAANASAVSSAALVQTPSKYGTGASTTADFGASTQDILHGPNNKTSLFGDPGSGWAQDGLAASEIALKGYALVGSDPGMPSITNGVTIFGAVEVTSAQATTILSATVDPTVCVVRSGDPQTGVGRATLIKLAITHSGAEFLNVTVWDKDTFASTTATGTRFFAEWSTWALVFDRTTWACYVQGLLAASGSCNLGASFSGINIGGEADSFTHGRAFPGTHAHIAVYGRKLSAGEVAQLNDAAAFAVGSGELASARIKRKLDSATWKNTRVLTTGVDALGPEGPPSGSIASIAGEVADYEDSQVFVDAAGQFRYVNRVTGYRRLPRAVLGENVSGGEIAYQPDQIYDFNPTFVYGGVAVSNTRVASNVQLSTSTLVAVDDTSSRRYSARRLSRDTRYANDFNGWDMAWWWLAKYAYPRQRIGTVVVSAAATTDTARWAFVCGVEVGDILTVTRRPIGQPAISVRCQVLNVSPNFDWTTDPVVAKVTLTLAAAPFQVAIANDAAAGVVGGTVLGA